MYSQPPTTILTVSLYFMITGPNSQRPYSHILLSAKFMLFCRRFATLSYLDSMIDLHTHSSASDGDLRPARLVEKAALMGLEALALTDHDTVSGLDEAQKAAKTCRNSPVTWSIPSPNR